MVQIHNSDYCFLHPALSVSGALDGWGGGGGCSAEITLLHDFKGDDVGF